ncbi:hypothetical protein BGZ92_004696 [Podila epicladia]|nr:hypothetical protein BGZ92_004696 [Podila epicladia]
MHTDTRTSSKSGNVHLQELGDSTQAPETPYPHQEPPSSPTPTGERLARPIVMGVSHEFRASMRTTQVKSLATDHQLCHRHHHPREHSHYGQYPFTENTSCLSLASFRQRRNFDDPEPYRMENEETMRIRAERVAKRGASESDRSKTSFGKELELAFTPMEHGHDRSERSFDTETTRSDNSTPQAEQGHGTLATLWLGLWRLLSWLVFPTMIAIAMSIIESGRRPACPLEAKLNGSCPLPSPPQASLTPHTVICRIWPFNLSGFLCSSPQKYHTLYTDLPSQEVQSLADLSSKIDWIQTALLNIGEQEDVGEPPAKIDAFSVYLARFEDRMIQVSKEVGEISKLAASGRGFSDQGSALKALLEEIRKAVSTPGKEQLTEAEIALITQVIDKHLDRRLEDDILQPDYALLSAGGRIIHRLTTSTYLRGYSAGLWDRLNVFRKKTASATVTCRSPEIALIPDVHAGECWAIGGSQGQITIRLARPIMVTAVTIEHADPRVILDVGSAPREVEVWSLNQLYPDDHNLSFLQGVLSSRPWTPSKDDKRVLEDLGDDQESDGESSKTTIEGRWWREGAPYPGARLLTIAEYRTKAASEATDQRWARQQTFSIPASKQSLSTVVLFRINSNWGHPEFTCLYRVQVHGHPPE